MPDRSIVAYYGAVAEKILPFLRGRRVGVRHHFDRAVVFRRHERVGRKKVWITIGTKEKLLRIVHQHGYEFFPHLEGDRDFWFALDIDVRAVPFSLGKTVVRTALGILEERRVKYLLNFSGGSGFHVRWAFSPAELPLRKWGFVRAIVGALRAETEKRLQASPQRAAFYRHIPRGDPITELNARDQEAQKSVLFDELILHRQATIRAPFSLHIKHRWVAVPIEPKKIEAFTLPRDATMVRVLAQSPGSLRGASPVGGRLPRNPVALFQRPPWTP